MSDRPGAIEIATWIGEAHWGRGYATEATHAVIDRAFCETGISILWCSNRVSNGRARRVIEAALGCGIPREQFIVGRFPIAREQVEQDDQPVLIARIVGAVRRSVVVPPHIAIILLVVNAVGLEDRARRSENQMITVA